MTPVSHRNKRTHAREIFLKTVFKKFQKSLGLFPNHWADWTLWALPEIIEDFLGHCPCPFWTARDTHPAQRNRLLPFSLRTNETMCPVQNWTHCTFILAPFFPAAPCRGRAS